jgi:hypothetical protein
MTTQTMGNHIRIVCDKCDRRELHTFPLGASVKDVQAIVNEKPCPCGGKKTVVRP